MAVSPGDRVTRRPSTDGLFCRFVGFVRFVVPEIHWIFLFPAPQWGLVETGTVQIGQNPLSDQADRPGQLPDGSGNVLVCIVSSPNWGHSISWGAKLGTRRQTGDQTGDTAFHDGAKLGTQHFMIALGTAGLTRGSGGVD